MGFCCPIYTRPQSGRQLAAARMLAGITQEELASQAGLHVNSIRYLERQDYITTGHSSQRVTEAMAALGVLFFSVPSCGVRLRHNGEFS
jgi:transcriptional regulator with XRE-family HTH domain